MNRIGSETVGSLFWIAVGGFFAIEGVHLGVRTVKNPGPGFLPVIMAALMILFSLLILLCGLRKPTESLARISWKRHLWVIGFVFLYIFLLDGFGFLISTLVLMFLLFRLLFEGEGRWGKVLIYSVGTALCSWLVFQKLAKMPFPEPRLFGL
jgi:hypothetical protein